MKTWVPVFLASLFALCAVQGPAIAQQAPPPITATLNASAASDALCTTAACITLQPLFNIGGGATSCQADVSNGPAGAFTGTGQFEATTDPTLTNWYQVPVTSYSAGAATQVTNFTAPGLYVFPSGVIGVRVRMTAFTVKSAIVTIACNGQGPLPGSGTTTIAANSSVNVTQVAGSTLVNTIGLPVTYYGKVNTVGQPCWGVNTMTGTAIASTVENVAITTTVALILTNTASTNIHICQATFTTVLTTGGTINLEYGTQTTNPCDTGTTVFASYVFGIAPAGDNLPLGNGAQDLYAVPSNVQVCVIGVSIAGSAQGVFDTAKY